MPSLLQGFVQQGHGFGTVTFAVPLTKDVGVVAAGSGQLGPVAGNLVMRKNIFEVAHRLVELNHGH